MLQLPDPKRVAAIAKSQRDDLMLALDKRDSEEHLIDFVKHGWKQLEPSQEFITGWPVEAICDHLEAVTTGQLTRLLINVPPGTTKSMTTNVFWPSWEWGPMNKPNLRYISASYADSLSIRDNMRGRDLILSDWYQSLWGDRFEFKGDQNAKMYYETDKTGWRKAASSNSALTGFRGDRIILDDPHSVKGADSEPKREETLRWFAETLPSRLNDLDKSAIVVIMQRVHERDVSGLILAEELGYEHLMIPMEYEPERKCYTCVKPSWHEEPAERVARIPGKDMFVHSADELPSELSHLAPLLDFKMLYPQDLRTELNELMWPDRFSEAGVDQLKKAMRSWGGTYAEVGQLQQRPSPRGGGLFKRDLWEYLDSAPKCKVIARGWDLAASDSDRSPWTVGVKMGLTAEDDIVILDVKRIRGTPGVVEKFIKSTVLGDDESVVQDMPQDPGQAGKVQKSAYAKLLAGRTVWFSPESGSKENRAMPLVAQQEAGNVYLVRAEWNDAFVAEAATFPAGTYKDQIDAASRAYARLLKTQPEEAFEMPMILV